MKIVYFKSSEIEWKYELDDEQYHEIIDQISEDNPDHQEMLDESFEILRDISDMDEDEIDEDDEIDQAISVAYIWYYFNDLVSEDYRILGDVVVLEDDDGTGVSVISASKIVVTH